MSPHLQELNTFPRIHTEALEYASRTLAYPNGDQDLRVCQAVTDSGFEKAFLFDHRSSGTLSTNRLRISRLRADSAMPMDQFKIILSDLHPALHHANGRS